MRSITGGVAVAVRQSQLCAEQCRQPKSERSRDNLIEGT